MSQEFSRLMKGEITHLAPPGCGASGASGVLCCRPLLNAFAVQAGHKARPRLAQQARRPRSPGWPLSWSWGPAPTPDQMARISGRDSIPWTLVSSTPGGARGEDGRTCDGRGEAAATGSTTLGP